MMNKNEIISPELFGIIEDMRRDLRAKIDDADKYANSKNDEIIKQTFVLSLAILAFIGATYTRQNTNNLTTLIYGTIFVSVTVSMLFGFRIYFIEKVFWINKAKNDNSLLKIYSKVSQKTHKEKFYEIHKEAQSEYKCQNTSKETPEFLVYMLIFLTFASLILSGLLFLTQS